MVSSMKSETGVISLRMGMAYSEAGIMKQTNYENPSQIIFRQNIAFVSFAFQTITYCLFRASFIE